MASEPRSTSFRYTEFSAPVSRKKRKNGQRTRPPLSTLVEQCRSDLAKDEWFARSKEIVRSVPIQGPSRIVCLGLGTPATSMVSRVQLAFFIELMQILESDIPKSSPNPKVSIYDPVFTDEDNVLFGELGFRISADLVVEGELEDGMIVYFMPHCDLELYDAVLKANWTERGVRNLVLVANRLEDYVENKPTRELEDKAPHVLRLVPFLRCYPLPPSRTWPAAFNNTAVQYVPHDAGLSCLFSEVVESPSCPGYSK